MESPKRLFSASSVACQRGGRVIFQNVSFALDAGGVLQLAGSNGAGKTSLLRILANALPAAEGVVAWDGTDIRDDDAHGARLAFLPPDDAALHPMETVDEVMRFFLSLSKTTGNGALQAMGIEGLKNKTIRQLSAGQKRRVSLARVLLRNAKLWLLDEPLNGLDAAAQDLFLQALAAHARNGGIAVIASHDIIRHDGIQRLAL